MDEIERKFLVDTTHPHYKALLQTQPQSIQQGYLKSEKDGVVRIRIMGELAFLTIKGPTTGISRPEFEYEIPLSDAKTMLATLCTDVLKKKRYIFPIDNGLKVELDVFEQIDLVIAEIELPVENAAFTKPSFLTKDVSEDPRYYNNVILDFIKAGASHIPEIE